MRLVSFQSGGGERFGAVVGEGSGEGSGEDVVDLTDALAPHGITSMRTLIASDRWQHVAELVAGAGATHALADIALLPPVTAPEKIWCIGVNYAERNAEYKDATPPPKYPSLFCRNPGSLVGHGAPIERPRVSAQFDYEGEIALVIGRAGRHIRRDEALSHVFGLTLCNEGSVRDWLRHGKFNVTQGKNFDRSGSLGPWIVTRDAVDLAAPLSVETRVNGEVRQHDSTARLMFPFDVLIEYLSTFATLQPGDVIVTGTPTGAGAHMTPPVWLLPGDVVEVSSPAIGVLRNVVVDEA